MSKADKMFEELGWLKVSCPQELEATFSDYYSDSDTVYEFFYRNSLTMRLYFIGNVYGFNHDEYHGVENEVELHLAIHEKMKELGWLDV